MNYWKIQDFFGFAFAVCSQKRDLLSRNDKLSSTRVRTPLAVLSHRVLSFKYCSLVTRTPTFLSSLFTFSIFLKEGFVSREFRYLLSEEKEVESIMMISQKMPIHLNKISASADGGPRSPSAHA